MFLFYLTFSQKFVEESCNQKQLRKEKKNLMILKTYVDILEPINYTPKQAFTCPSHHFFVDKRFRLPGCKSQLFNQMVNSPVKG